MKNKLIWFLLGVAVVLAILWVKRALYLIGHSDPDYNTVYSPGYNETIFNSGLQGKTENELKQLLGEPLGKSHEDFLDIILYTENKEDAYLSRDNDFVKCKVGSSKKYIYFYFDSLGNITQMKFHRVPVDTAAFKGLNKTDVIKKLGKPDDEIIRDGNCETLSYAALTTGTKSGKSSSRHVREILLNRNGVAVKVIKKVVDSFHPPIDEED